MYPLYRHYKGRHYLRLATVTHSETLEPHVAYRSLYDNPVSRSWVRPEAMFLEVVDGGTPRFTRVGSVRTAMPQDERELLLFGHETWGNGLSAETFVRDAMASPNHQRGVRHLLEDLQHQLVSKVGVLRFARGVVGLYSIATRPEARGKGYGSVLVRAVMELLRLEEPETRFLLFSEVAPDMYERLGFRVLPDEFQHFRPSVAMATGDTELSEFEVACLREYF